jgi:hypothetical protein
MMQRLHGRQHDQVVKHLSTFTRDDEQKHQSSNDWPIGPADGARECSRVDHTRAAALKARREPLDMGADQGHRGKTCCC